MSEEKTCIYIFEFQKNTNRDCCFFFADRITFCSVVVERLKPLHTRWTHSRAPLKPLGTILPITFRGFQSVSYLPESRPPLGTLDPCNNSERCPRQQYRVGVIGKPSGMPTAPRPFSVPKLFSP